MNKDVSKSFESHFGNLKDPGVERTRLYPLSEILFVVLTGSVCGAESWRDFVLFGEERLDFLQEYYPFENGIPSKNTFSRVFAALDTEVFKECFIEWVKSLQAIRYDQSLYDYNHVHNVVLKSLVSYASIISPLAFQLLLLRC